MPISANVYNNAVHAGGVSICGVHFKDPTVAFMLIMMKFNEALDRYSDGCQKSTGVIAQDMSDLSSDYNDFQTILNNIIAKAKDTSDVSKHDFKNDQELKAMVRSFLKAYNKLRADAQKLDDDLHQMVKPWKDKDGVEHPAPIKPDDHNYLSWVSHMDKFRNDIFMIGAGEMYAKDGQYVDWGKYTYKDARGNEHTVNVDPKDIKGGGVHCSIYQWALDIDNSALWDADWNGTSSHTLQDSKGGHGVADYFMNLFHASKGDKWHGDGEVLGDTSPLNHLSIWKNGGTVIMGAPDMQWRQSLYGEIAIHTFESKDDGSSWRDEYDLNEPDTALGIEDIVTHHADAMLTDSQQGMQVFMQEYNSLLNVIKSVNDNNNASNKKFVDNQRS